MNKSKTGRTFQDWYDELPALFENDAIRQDLNVLTCEELRAAHYYPSTWEPYQEQDDHEARVTKFRGFFEARKQTTLQRLREVFSSPPDAVSKPIAARWGGENNGSGSSSANS